MERVFRVAIVNDYVRTLWTIRIILAVDALAIFIFGRVREGA